MFNLKKIFYLGVPSDMDPVEAKYVGMCNIGALFFILTSPLYIFYYLLNDWMFLCYEQLGFMAVLCLTLVFNQKRKYTLALVWFGSILNYHLVILSVIFGWAVKVYYLIFFTAGGAIMLFRRRASSLIIPSVIASLLLYYLAYFLSMVIDPLYTLSARQISITNVIIELTFFVLVVSNAMIGRYGSIASEDQLKAEMARSNDLLQKLKDLDRQKTMFFQNISHEFRTPLTLILGPLDTLMAGTFGRFSPWVKEQLFIIQRNAARLLSLINQLLDLSKLDEKKMPLRTVRENVAALISDTVASFGAYADKLGIRLTFTDAARAIEMDYDPQILEKVLINLISNALKFTPSGGWVTLSLSEISEGKEVLIRVRDSGRGIPPKELPHIFDRFHQVDGTTTRDQEGTGIGLSLVKEFVDLHGGRIEVESLLQKGTEFRVILPKEIIQDPYPGGQKESQEVDEDFKYYFETPVAEGEGPVEDPGFFGGKSESTATVLIIEDNTDMRGYIRQILSDQYWTIEASDGEEGLIKTEEMTPDIILSDVMMPKIDGYELCRRLKDSERLKNIPVVLLTARASEEMTLDGIEAGAYDYITKPFSPKILLAKINGILERQEQQQRQSQYDGLTGLLTRAFWEKKTFQEMEKNRRYSHGSSIAFIDLDDFKKINDTYSHQTGDMVLRTLASLLTTNLRASDLTGRFGGEEFVVYFPETTARTAADSLGRLLKLFSQQNIDGKNLGCTFSAGVVEINPLRNLSLGEYLSRADVSMYAAKKIGKARVLIHQD